MRKLFRSAILAVALSPLPASYGAQAEKLHVVAAENFYGDIAAQIGGNRVAVESIMTNPDQDPHLFETTPAVGRAIGAAAVIVYNGAAYDPWMDDLLAAQPNPARTIITAAALTHRNPGDNPHLWYDPATAPAIATALASALAAADPASTKEYRTRLEAFLSAWKPVEDKVASLREKFAGVAVTATEPVFGYMADAVGLAMQDRDFQRAVMNDTEPSARDVAAFEDGLKSGKVKVLLYNKQVTDPATEQLLAIARNAKVPIVGVTETKPDGVSFQEWLLNELGDLGRALGDPTS